MNARKQLSFVNSKLRLPQISIYQLAGDLIKTPSASRRVSCSQLNGLASAYDIFQYFLSLRGRSTGISLFSKIFRQKESSGGLLILELTREYLLGERSYSSLKIFRLCFRLCCTSCDEIFAFCGEQYKFVGPVDDGLVNPVHRGATRLI